MIWRRGIAAGDASRRCAFDIARSNRLERSYRPSSANHDQALREQQPRAPFPATPFAVGMGAKIHALNGSAIAVQIRQLPRWVRNALATACELESTRSKPDTSRLSIALGTEEGSDEIESGRRDRLCRNDVRARRLRSPFYIPTHSKSPFHPTSPAAKFRREEIRPSIERGLRIDCSKCASPARRRPCVEPVNDRYLCDCSIVSALCEYCAGRRTNGARRGGPRPGYRIGIAG